MPWSSLSRAPLGSPGFSNRIPQSHLGLPSHHSYHPAASPGFVCHLTTPRCFLNKQPWLLGSAPLSLKAKVSEDGSASSGSDISLSFGVLAAQWTSVGGTAAGRALQRHGGADVCAGLWSLSHSPNMWEPWSVGRAQEFSRMEAQRSVDHSWPQTDDQGGQLSPQTKRKQPFPIQQGPDLVSDKTHVP
jgi:hypothetical protein